MDKLDRIVHHQTELMNRFWPIEAERKAIFKQTWPVDLNTFDGQEMMRDRAFWLVQEVYEVLEANSTEPFQPKVGEELADVLHFLVEMAICAGLDITRSHSVDKLNELFSNNILKSLSVRDYAMRLVQMIASSLHVLKIKPWTQNPKPSDVDLCRFRLGLAFISYAQFCQSLGFQSATEMYGFYMGKAEENHKRIDTKY
jgi:NTP pyrophosphatase (non-canonical NTP hydrolase)